MLSPNNGHVDFKAVNGRNTQSLPRRCVHIRPPKVSFPGVFILISKFYLKHKQCNTLFVQMNKGEINITKCIYLASLRSACFGTILNFFCKSHIYIFMHRLSLLNQQTTDIYFSCFLQPLISCPIEMCLE